MTVMTQIILGSVLIGLALASVGLRIVAHTSVYSLLAVFFGAVGGQQFGQAHARIKSR